MNTQVLTLGIVLSFATTACTGFGVQTGPTLASEIYQEQGLGSLWIAAADEAPDNTMEAEFRDDRELADLWIEADGESNWNGETARESSTRASATLQTETLTRSVFGTDSNRTQVLLK